MVQRKCKPKTVKLVWIAEVQPFLSKDTRNKIVEVKVEEFPSSAQKKPSKSNSILHFGSDEGAKMATTYHSIISTVKQQGRSALDYLGTFFVNIINY